MKNKTDYFVNPSLLTVFVLANGFIITFGSFFIGRNEFEGGFASVKVTTEYRGEAALAQWRSQLEWEAIAHVIYLQLVGTARA